MNEASTLFWKCQIILVLFYVCFYFYLLILCLFLVKKMENKFNLRMLRLVITTFLLAKTFVELIGAIKYQ